ncbi:squalene/oxidosqualene cyclase-like protein [Kineothrix alysoides]|uniref:Squalene/oxidosqualene cyclase-like protein n=1 Tax=Kineothrix alysoides TaxID=1469948 RepID=A0A4R1QYH7_9FIRM|nr:prenyltransferase/squalene oxidase repeat-containing protein [Kineothrix alysoides]TCL57630.1 squalene/oxidosqualene cyclase-like protein [Kineothrix alysoides]
MFKKVVSYSIIFILLLLFVNPVVVEAAPITDEQLEDSIVRAGDYLLSLQTDRGLWQADIRINPRETAYFMITAKYLQIEDLEEAIGTSATWLLDHINEDGGWGFFDEGGTSEVSISAIVRLALLVNGVDENREELKRSAVFVENNGGLKNTDIFCKTFYALFNLYEEPWDSPHSKIFFPDLSILYLDNTDEYSPYSSMAWGREAGIAMSVIKEYRKRENLHIKSSELNLAEQWMVSHQLEDGCWYTLLGTCLNMIALHEIDSEKHAPRIERGMEWINSNRESDGYQKRFILSVWDTSFAISALSKSNIDSSADSLLKAATWIVNAQTQGGGYNWSNAPSGGWSYNEYNILYPDNDDTALAINALNDLRFTSYSAEFRKRMAVEKGKEWLLYMQNDDGGWGTFERFDGDKDFKDPTESTEDPSVADITGHVLTALSSCGYTVDDPVIQKCLDYIKKDQNDQGAWYGRWGLCYLYGTSCILQGLADIGYDMNDEFIVKAVDWLLAQQNDDGGWGEHFSWWSEKNGISFTEMGPSTPEQTAWVIMALMKVDSDKYMPQIEEGVQYILDNQKEYGGWEHPYYTVLGLNPYKNTYYPHYFSLAALSDYAKVKGIVIDTPAANGEVRTDKETYLMLDNFSYEDVADEVKGSLKKADLSVTFEETGKNAFLLGLYNGGKEALEDVVVTVYDEKTNDIILTYDFDTLKGEERISKVLSFSDEREDSKSLRIVSEYTSRGEGREIVDRYQISLTKVNRVNISIFTIVVFVVIVLLCICLFILFRNTNIQLIKFAFKNLGRNRTRTVLTFIGIVIGISATAGSISLGQAFDQKLRKDFESFGAGRIIILSEKVDISVSPPTQSFEKAASLRLTDDVVNEIKKIENVKSVCPVMNYETTVTFRGESTNCFIQFVDLDTFQQMTPLQIDKGRILEKGDGLTANVGYDISAKAFSETIEVGDTLRIGNFNVSTKGIFQETDGMSGRIESIVTPNIVIYLPLEMADKFVRKDYYDVIEVKVIDTNKTKTTDEKINNILEDKYPNRIFSTVYTEKLQSTVSEILYQFDLIISLIGIFCLLVSGIGIMNMVIVNMTERRQEIGIMMAIGAPNKTIIKILVLELVFLGIVGGIAGFIGGLFVVLITQFIAQILTMPNFAFILSLSMFLGIAIVLFFGVIPIIKELKKEPIEALR